MSSSKSSLPRSQERGAALVVTTTLTLVMIGFGLTVMSAVESATEEHGTSKAQLQRLAIAEAGVRSAVLNLTLGGTGAVATEAAPMVFGGGGMWVTAVDNGDGTFTLTSRGSYLAGQRVVEARVRESGHVFSNALYAGNSSDDLNYQLDLGGFGAEADQINGSVYSGGDVNVWGDAVVQGGLRAAGTVTGRAGEEGVTQPGFDFSGMDYANTADVNVADEFDAHGYSASAPSSGTAIQVPETLDAHVFRKNPSDRSDLHQATAKDDYVLEDPYEPVGADTSQDGSDAWRLSFKSEPGDTGYRKVIYIDGNLWVDGRPTWSYEIGSVGSDGTQVTFVVKGNIYFTDNIFLQNTEKDGVAFIALKDENETDSGNIYFGDPVGGTLEHMHAFMYAENDFYDNHLDSQGQGQVEVTGTMAAGNHVAINRTFENHHSRLTVTPDARLGSGLSLPGIPQQTQTLRYEVLTWIEVSPNG